LPAGSQWTLLQQREPGERCVYTYQMAALFCVKSRHGRHLEGVTSNQKSDLTMPIYLKNNHAKFHPDTSETTEP